MKIKALYLTATATSAAILCAAPMALAQSAPPLGVVQQFSVLGNSGVTGSAGAGTLVSGDVGSSPTATISNFPPSSVTGSFAVHGTNDAAVVTARANANSAYGFLAAQGPGTVRAAQLSGAVLTSGIYSFTGGAADLAANGTLTLNGPGIFIFQVDSALTANVGSNITGSANPCSVFWRVGTSATLNGPAFFGQVFAEASVTVGGGANVTGRVVAGSIAGGTGAVTMAGAGGNTIGGCASVPVVPPVCPVITVAPSTLPNGTMGVAYSQTLSASGGAAPYVFSLTTGALPAGLTLTAAGVVAGTPTVAGTSTFTIRAMDVNLCFADRVYTIVIAAAPLPPPVCPVITLAPATLPNGTVGVAFSQALSGSGGTAPYSFGLTTGALPAGLTMTAAGLIAGTPTIAGTSTLTIRTTDANGCFADRAYMIVIAAAPLPPPVCPVIALAPATLPGGIVGAAYNQTLTGSGGAAPYVFGVTAGALPAGLALTGAGQLSGTPTVAGTSTFTVRGTDANGCFADRPYTIVVTAAPLPPPVCPVIALAPAALPNGTVGIAYSQALSGSGGTAPYTFGVTTGALPGGLTLTATGLLAGTPTIAGTSTLTIRATDVNGCFADRPYTIIVAAAPLPPPVCPVITLAPATLPGGIVGAAYNQTLTGNGGVAPYVFGVTTGALPAGLALTGDGQLSGTPTVAGTSTFTVRGTDANGCFADRPYTIVVAAAPLPPPVCPVIALAPATLPNGTVGIAYSQALSGSGGTAPYTFGVITGALPGGLTLTAAGLLAGTPTIAGTSTLTIRATDVNGCFADRPYTIIVAAAPLPPPVCPTITLAPSSLATAMVGTLYSQTVTGSGGAAPYSFGLTTGALPAGLTLTSAGVVSGTPTTAGTSRFTIRGTDANGCFADLAFILSTAPAGCPVITLTTPANGTVGVVYSQTLTASGGLTPYTFSVNGALPTGLVLTPAGVLSGTPTVAGTFTIRATDANGCFGERSFTVLTPVPTMPQGFLLLLALALAGAAYWQMRRAARA